MAPQERQSESNGFRKGLYVIWADCFFNRCLVSKNCSLFVFWTARADNNTIKFIALANCAISEFARMSAFPNFSFVDVILFCYYFLFPITIIAETVFTYHAELHYSRLVLTTSILVFCAAGYVLAKYSYNFVFNRFREETNLFLTKKILKSGWATVFFLSGVPRLSVYLFYKDYDALYLIFFLTVPLVLIYYMIFCANQKEYCFIKYSGNDVVTIVLVFFANSVALITPLFRETRLIVFLFHLFFSPITFASSLEYIQVYSGRLRIVKERLSSPEIEEDQNRLQHL
ncbi:hypothetical protein CAEBREN_12607 [Caenorhabditis brenneri]|uniref:Uncharacterized protein n=1 Tax=Caenorhabditis brenneri TaxID=135651 RepID=G0N817_CAEBE|nr:hypothetical protein CAEBREN_12607 [Caenorhabditis brenneri]